jgi:hypothetical protein
MRKLFWQMNVTLDGFMEGPNRELTHTAEFADPDFDRYASEMLRSIDGMLLGRVEANNPATTHLRLIQVTA